MSSDRAFWTSFNPILINKQKPDNLAHLAEGFQPIEVTLTQFEETIKRGWAFSYVYKDEKRKAANFVATDFLAVDFDGGITIEECLALDVVKKYASLGNPPICGAV